MYKQIASTKLSVRDSEFTERADTLRREKERLRRVQARVREVITADETLRRCLEAAAQCDEDLDMHMHVHTTPQEENDFMMELLKEVKGDRIAIPDRLYDKLECGEHVTDVTCESEPSVYSSVNDVDLRQDCRVKIVKMENIKKLMEDWQKMLNMVINRTIDVASQEAMGDYSKPLECTCELRGYSDASIDERCLGWALNNEESFAQQGQKMQLILEETRSQMAIEEITSSEAGDDNGGRDMVAI
ncbi:PAS/PAC sensor hybrid histidine kinase [Operophtera brumata]|uniref:PAS/PAC sensor hybrid histidine kinase n=1 Tax=Operophtera brumata TaxID=104452 RepID=A0A0L7LWD7_OPEBR|nr:PAS/PAC sensor hybrid histidine kinase [Operophtera brumata]